MRPRFCYLLAVVLLLFAATAQGAESVFLHPKLKAKEVNVKALVVLPSMVTMTKQGVKGSEGMAKEEDATTDQLTSAVTADLKESGLSAEAPFTEAALNSNNELKYAVADVQKKFDEIAPQLYRKPKDVKKGRFTLGDMVAVLNSKGNTDALVIIRSAGVKITKGKGMLTGGLVGLAASKNATFTTHVVLVDAKTGDVLFLGIYITSGIPKDKAFEKSFKKILNPK